MQGEHYDLDLLLGALRDRSMQAARQCGLPSDCADDLAQESFRAMWEDRGGGEWPPSREEQETTILRIASRWARRRSRERERMQRIAAGGAMEKAAGPPLCRGLRAPFRTSPARPNIEALIELAAVAISRDPAILDAEQYRIFTLVYRDRTDPAVVAGAMRVPLRAFRRRLARISLRIEACLVAAMKRHLPAPVWRLVADRVGEQNRCRGRRLVEPLDHSCAIALEAGLRALLPELASPEVI